MLKLLIQILIGSILISSARAASPISYSIGGGWYQLSFPGPGTYYPFSLQFSSNVSTLLSFADVYSIGDRYEVYDNPLVPLLAKRVDVDEQTLIGVTSLPTPWAPGKSFAALPGITFTSELGWSKGFWVIPPGEHNITFRASPSAFVDGQAYFRLDNYFVLG